MGRYGILVAILLAIGPAGARIVFEADTRTVIVSDFPDALPARLDTIRRADRANGWGLLAYAPETQTWTLRANLQVGRNDGTATWMQIGCPALPRETLVLDGTLTLCPYLVVGENDRYTPRRENRLTLGDPSNAVIRAALKIAGAGHTVMSGKLPGPDGALRNGFGGELRIYHGTLASASGKRELARPYWSGELTLDHAVVSGFNAPALFGIARHRSDLRDTVFEDNAGVFGSPAQYAEGCRFRGNGTVIQGLGGDTVTLVGCAWRDNLRNWDLGTGGTIECLDCDIAPGTNPDSYGFRQQTPGRALVRRHAVAKAVTAAGVPVAGVRMTFTAHPAGDDLVANNRAVTGADGCTPPAGHPRAVRLTESLAMAAPTGSFQTVRYTYDIEARTPGGAAVRRTGVVPPHDGEPIAICIP